MTKSNSDKRSFPRTSLAQKIQVRAGDSRTTAQLVDITVQGISFKLERTLSPGSRVTIILSDSEELRSTELEAEVIRCDSPASVNPPQNFLFYIAAKFIEVNDEFLMDSLALVHGKKNHP
jgi:hypothetical protein